MRIVRTVLGWVVSVTLFALVVVLVLVGQAGPELLGFVPTWIFWTIASGPVVLLGWALLSPKTRRQWRQSRAEARERKRKLANFELD